MLSIERYFYSACLSRFLSMGASALLGFSEPTTSDPGGAVAGLAPFNRPLISYETESRETLFMRYEVQELILGY